MNTIIESITYIFKEKGWETKVGYIFIALIATYIISGILSFTIQVPIEIMKTYLEESGRNMPMLQTASSAASSLSSIFSLPVTLYLLGYLLGTVKNIYEGKKNVLDDNKDIVGTFVRGVKLAIVKFLVTLPTTLIGITFLVMTFIGAAVVINANRGGLLLGMLVILLTLSIVLLMGVLNTVITYAAGYVYIKTGSFREAMNLKNIMDTLKANERPLLKLFLHLLALNFVQAIITMFSLVLICVGFVVFPAIALIGYFARAYIVGRYYLMMRNLEK